ncbi:hypothetical protein FACS18942_08250 [Planctomycetales bacterium]|nr:hypothetical protein FACS18942_08250 [Planctomycetales bacterium]
MSEKNLQSADLQAGDVLLYNSDTRVAWAIRTLDGTDVNHAGLYLGKEIVGEALCRGIIQQPLQQSIDGCNWIAVRRYNGNLPSEGVTPVLENAANTINIQERYAFEQIVLLALICTRRKLDFDGSPILKRLVKKVLNFATQKLGKIKSQGEPMICSEFVYRSFTNAGCPVKLQRDDGFVGLSLTASTGHNPVPKRFADASITCEEIGALIQQYQVEIGESDTNENIMFGCISDEEVTIDELDDDIHSFLDVLSSQSAPLLCGIAESQSVDPNFVTPGDLLNSPSFTDIGKLKPQQ